MDATVRVTAIISKRAKDSLKQQAVKQGLMFSALLKQVLEQAARKAA